MPASVSIPDTSVFSVKYVWAWSFVLFFSEWARKHETWNGFKMLTPTDVLPASGAFYIALADRNFSFIATPCHCKCRNKNLKDLQKKVHLALCLQASTEQSLSTSCHNWTLSVKWGRGNELLLEGRTNTLMLVCRKNVLEVSVALVKSRGLFFGTKCFTNKSYTFFPSSKRWQTGNE